jgi:hypothetical protein
MGKIYQKRFLKGTMVYDEQKVNGLHPERIVKDEVKQVMDDDQRALIQEMIRRQRAFHDGLTQK